MVGTLDILAATIQFFLKTNKGPAPIFKYIASAVFGKEAFAGNNWMVIYGLVFRYTIALLFTVFFFFIAATLPAILKFKFFTGIVYGTFIWTVMQFIVLPLSKTAASPINFTGAITAIIILIICIGIPLSLIANKEAHINRN